MEYDFSKLNDREFEALNPSQYIFITTKKLSRANKQEIKKIFDPYIKMENDIFGKEDLNDFFNKN